MGGRSYLNFRGKFGIPLKNGVGGSILWKFETFYIKSLVGTYVGKSQEKNPGDKNFCKKVPVF